MSADFPNLTVVHHPLVQHKLTWLRSTSAAAFAPGDPEIVPYVARECRRSTM